MARDLDIDNLTDEDRQYILQRPWLKEEILLQGGDLGELGLDGEKSLDDPRTIVTSPSLESSLNGGTEGVVPDDEYDKLNKQQLQAEIDRRNEQLEEDEEPISRTGTVVELRNRLREFDAETAPEDDSPES